MATTTWEVESVADEAALKIKMNELRAAGNATIKVMWNPGASAFTVIYLEPAA